MPSTTSVLDFPHDLILYLHFGALVVLAQAAFAPQLRSLGLGLVAENGTLCPLHTRTYMPAVLLFLYLCVCTILVVLSSTCIIAVVLLRAGLHGLTIGYMLWSLAFVPIKSVKYMAKNNL